jgi:hypothetical protein
MTVADPVVHPIDGPATRHEMAWWLRGFTLDLRALGLFRVAIGLCLMASLILRLPYAGTFYSSAGVLPATGLLESRDPTISLHLISDAPAAQLVLLLVAIGFAAALVLNHRPRLAAIASWVLWTSLLVRNPLATHAGDHELRLLLFWSMFLPYGRSRGTYLAPAGVALILQICAVYWFAFAEKMDPVWLTERSAVYYTLQLDMLAKPLGSGLLDHYQWTQWLTTGTLGLELLGPFLAISPIATNKLRLVAVLAFIGFHLGLSATTQLGTFPYISSAAWLVFLPFRGDPGAPVRDTGYVRNAVVIASVMFIALNLLAPTTRPRNEAEAGKFRRFASLIGWEQRWTMFGPRPTTADGWYVMPGFRNGEWTDVWNGGPAIMAKPPDVLGSYRSMDWVEYLHQLRNPRNSAVRRYLARYLCRREALDSFRLIFVAEPTPPPGRTPGPIRPDTLWNGACP